MLGPVCSVLGFALLAQGDAVNDPPRGGDGATLASTALPAEIEENLPVVPPPDLNLMARPDAAAAASKRARWLLEKQQRPTVHVSDAALASTAPKRARMRARADADIAAAKTPIGARLFPLVTLFNMKTREALPVFAGPRLPGEHQQRPFCKLLRDHFTNQATDMDPQLLEALARAAHHFKARRIEIVSGYRSPKYNLMLRKKGRQVAESSQHTVGHAVDFRVRGVPTRKLWQFVRSLRLGGVGFYPHSQFVHCDTGPIRFWRGS